MEPTWLPCLLSHAVVAAVELRSICLLINELHTSWFISMYRNRKTHTSDSSVSHTTHTHT